MDSDLQALAQGHIYDRSVSNVPRDRVDLAGIRSQLEQFVKRAQDVASSVHSLADTIIGPRPEQGGVGGIAPQSMQPSLAEMVEELGRALNRAESGLNRF